MLVILGNRINVQDLDDGMQYADSVQNRVSLSLRPPKVSRFGKPSDVPRIILIITFCYGTFGNFQQECTSDIHLILSKQSVWG